MRRFIVLFTGLAAAAAVLVPFAQANTASNNNPTQCGGGKLVVNVTYGLTNDADSGFFGDWAVDSLNRHLQVFDVGSGKFCVTVDDTGSFVTTGPLSPQNGAPLSAEIKGVINGGYVTDDFTATLNPTPDYKARGNLGSFDATGAHPTFLSYFSGSPIWNYASWGWTYHTAQNGNWVNASTGSSGDITG